MMLLLTKAMIFLHMFVGVILIGIILLQRGRGGGLAGAFGGMGGQSAFGTKAGDVFTRITIVIATIWLVLGGLCILAASSAHVPNKFKAGAAVGLKNAPEKDAEAEEPAKPDTAKPGTSDLGEKKSGDASEGGKKSGDATDEAKPVTPKSKDESSGETPKGGDEKAKPNEQPADAKDGAEPAASSPAPPKSSEGNDDGGTSAPDKPIEKKLE